jgi:dihydroxy-acid dehydratase
VGQVSPEAYLGGPIASVREGDEITIDIPRRSIHLHLSDDEIKERLAHHKPQQREVPPGYMRRYIRMVSSAARGAVLDLEQDYRAWRGGEEKKS